MNKELNVEQSFDNIDWENSFITVDEVQKIREAQQVSMMLQGDEEIDLAQFFDDNGMIPDDLDLKKGMTITITKTADAPAPVRNEDAIRAQKKIAAYHKANNTKKIAKYVVGSCVVVCIGLSAVMYYFM